MVRKGYTPDQIISKLRQAEILLSQGNRVIIVLLHWIPYQSFLQSLAIEIISLSRASNIL